MEPIDPPVPPVPLVLEPTVPVKNPTSVGKRELGLEDDENNKRRNVGGKRRSRKHKKSYKKSYKKSRRYRR